MGPNEAKLGQTEQNKVKQDQIWVNRTVQGYKRNPYGMFNILGKIWAIPIHTRPKGTDSGHKGSNRSLYPIIYP